MQSIGDMAQTLVMRHHQTKLREQINFLGVELTTGVVQDKAAHLGGDLTVLATLDRSLMALDGFRVATAEATYVADVMQTALGQLQNRIEDLSPGLLNVELVTSETLRTSMARDAENALEATLASLNSTAAGRAVFGGVATDRAAISDADTILNALRIELAGETTLAGIQTKLDAWFDTPGGGFETIAYEGSTTSVADTRLSSTDTAKLDVRADDPVFRDMIKALSMAALSSDATLAFPQGLKAEIIFSSGAQMVNAQSELTDLRAGVGNLQARIEETETRNASERTATQLARLKLIGADQYETAVRLQDVQVQLEALYSVTARASRMSFVEFM
ncbi:flagellin [Puniceibacterium sediminis]|uniref:Flagellar hook-associated protein 3 FlgL n=1 Tax=Puniceibacterium sediminis TaxID=1608407 RepID=A0A238VS57_9RHOB|nr:flagellin [Puniceibacterium sediminis]SNR37078.1 flagellar hook-associated protein 3 FlgL [Puniceibacterium sediminis]